MTPRNRISRLGSLAAVVLAFTTAFPASAAPPTATTAEQLAEQAYEQHASGRDAEAIATYLRAYELSQAAAILFNVATIYDRKLGERGLAEEYYRRYLAAPDAEPELVRKATERLTALKKDDEDEAATKRAAIAVAPVPTTPPPASAPPPPPAVAPPIEARPAEASGARSNGHTLRTAGIVVGVVGVAGVGASMVLGALAKGKNDDANAVCNGAACSSENGVSLANQAGSLATASTISFVAGLALAGGGVAMFFLAPKDSPASPVARITVSPLLGPSNVGLGVGGSF
jgi:hypothetical protein